MAWWQEHLNDLSDPFVIGGGLAMVTSYLSSIRRNPHARRIARLTEAGTCSLLGFGLSKACVLYVGLSEDWAVPISIFVAWIGTDQIKSLLVKLIDKFILKEDDHESK